MRAWFLGAAVALAACGSSDSDGDGDGAASSGSSSGGASSGTSGGSGPGGSSGGGSSGGVAGGLPYGFRYGINMGHRNASWGDDLEATLASRAGARSIRVKLPASHLKTWGYAIETGDNATYATLGMHDHIGFLIGSETVGQSTAPAGSEDWQNEYYIPKNLYEPIFQADGSVNPQNYWASYVFQTITTYKPWIHVWHIWNEPDFTADYHVTDSWKTEPPKAADLPRFHGSIFDYVRLLRIAKEVAHKADPEALIATGGIGYPSFLSAILRYTDNPDGGAISADYPAKGGAYFDVLDFHYYPVFGAKGSDAAVDDFLASKAALAQTLDAAGAKVRGWNVSETGAPSQKTTDYPDVGGPEYARNYLLKVMTMAQVNGIGGVDWFILANGDANGKDAYQYMGLYQDYSAAANVDQAVQTDTGKAYATLAQVVGDAPFDAAATAALALPASVHGAAFVKDGKRHLVVWAATAGTSEDATASLDVTSAAGFDSYAWDGTKTAAAAGKVTLALTGSPTLLSEK